MGGLNKRNKSLFYLRLFALVCDPLQNSGTRVNYSQRQ